MILSLPITGLTAIIITLLLIVGMGISTLIKINEMKTRIKVVSVSKGVLNVQTYYYPQVKHWFWGWCYMVIFNSREIGKQISLTQLESLAERFNVEEQAKELLQKYENQKYYSEKISYK